jgi:outer membrane lipoprotein-sorting protein
VRRSRGRRVLLIAALAVASALPGATASAQDPAKSSASSAAKSASERFEELLADLSRRLSAVKTLRSRFEQRKYLEVFEDVVTSEGTLALEVPDKLRWEYVKPVKSVLTVSGRTASRERISRKGERTRKTYALDDEPITAITAQQVFLWTRGDFEKARGSYDLSLVAEKPPVVRATPKEEKVREVVTSVELTFSEDRTKLTGVTLLEKNKAKTVISFLDVELDPKLPENLFRIDR